MDKCFECGKPAQHQHHVIPKSKGGTKTIPLCEQCHYKVHNVIKTDCKHLTSEALQKLKLDNKKYTSQAPFGYKFDAENNMVKDERETRKLRIMQDLRAKGLSYMKIEAELKKQNIRNRNNGFYNFTFIGKVLNRSR